MANNTVYPFGPGGQLPSGVAIVNDCVTGGADKALAAEQGVILKDKADNTLTQVDLSTMGKILGVITSNGKWSGGQTNHQSVEVPVKPGQKYRIRANASTASYYAFFSALSFYSASGTPSYATGYDNRISISANETVDVTIPADTTYLYICMLNAATNQAPQSVMLVEERAAATKGDNQELRNEIYGQQTELCNYATDSFAFTGASSDGKIEKVGTSGYLISNTKSSSGKYFLYTLPSGMVDGKTYLVSFDYKSWLSDSWALSVVNNNGSTQQAPVRSVRIPASGSGRISWLYTFYKGDACLRLASVSQSAGACLLIENLSITADNLPISELVKRVERVEPYPNGGTFLPYFGRKIDLTERSYQFSEWMSNTSTHQSSACYGDYLVTFSDKMVTINLYNLATKTLLATVTQTALDNFHHCNQAFFGTERYDEGDAFPLVYLTVNNNGTEAGGYMEVYRIVPTMGDSDYNAFTIELVQTVTLPIMSEQNALGNANFVLDERSGFLYTYSRNNDSAAENRGKLRITKWAMPTLSQGNVTLTDADILDGWETGTRAVNSQGAAIRNHLLFIFRGYQNVGYTYLSVFDLVRKDTVAIIDLLSDGFTMEPEGVFFWGETLCVSNNTVYRFFFK